MVIVHIEGYWCDCEDQGPHYCEPRPPPGRESEATMRLRVLRKAIPEMAPDTACRDPDRPSDETD